MLDYLGSGNAVTKTFLMTRFVNDFWFDGRIRKTFDISEIFA